MANPPRILQVGTNQSDTYNIINENFRSAVQDIGDLGALVSTTFSGSLTIPTVTVGTAVISILSSEAPAVSGFYVRLPTVIRRITAISPQTDIYIGTNNNLNYLFPNGASLTGTTLNLVPNIVISGSIPAGTLGNIIVTLFNRDNITHTYYYSVQVIIIGAKSIGAFR